MNTTIQDKPESTELRTTPKAALARRGFVVAALAGLAAGLSGCMVVPVAPVGVSVQGRWAWVGGRRVWVRGRY